MSEEKVNGFMLFKRSVLCLGFDFRSAGVVGEVTGAILRSSLHLECFFANEQGVWYCLSSYRYECVLQSKAASFCTWNKAMYTVRCFLWLKFGVVIRCDEKVRVLLRIFTELPCQ